MSKAIRRLIDPRIHVIKVTPDPGVIEVNIHPAKTWREQVDITKALYEEAQACRLSTEKFLLDGRHTGTGGGNHIVWARQTRPIRRSCAARPAEKHHRPIGKTIPACPIFSPACSSAPPARRRGWTKRATTRCMSWKSPLTKFRRAPPPIFRPGWWTDFPQSSGRLHRQYPSHRNLHRQALFAGRPTGRLGLVEFRNFEMPPHAEMSLAQSLLLRA
jgi:hypothetical protein